ncbi:MAG: hypothetical protein EON52_08790 [Actinomycetales bacterium]|nr:MAG: hypothetical protein EON52_08790 [Actinomycetales bacterium]
MPAVCRAPSAGVIRPGEGPARPPGFSTNQYIGSCTNEGRPRCWPSCPRLWSRGRGSTVESTASLSERVREVVRERRIDPGTQVEEVRRAAAEVVAAHERRSLTGAVRPLDEPDRMVGLIVADVSGFGPLQPYLDDPTVEEIWINAPDRVFVARHGLHELTPVVLSAGQVRELIERMLQSSGRRLDISQPFVDAMLPGGHRLHVVLEGISRDHAAVNIRKFVHSRTNVV